MPVTIVVGGQYGSEGKGKVATLAASRMRAPWVVRCGGPNSGHTTRIRGEERVLRQLPSGVDERDAMFGIAAGCVVDERLLIDEIELCRLSREQVVVDSRAVLVEDADRHDERASLVDSIGSTGSGNGRALARRLLRSSDVRLAESSADLKKFVTIKTLAPELHSVITRGGDVLIEGSQGFGLSLLHSPDYPFVTSKDTSAAGFASDVGIAPRFVDSVVMVIRSFPIRVGGNSGPLANEISWEEVQRVSQAPICEPEYTSVTKRLRRVGLFDIEMVRAASKYNAPTSLAVMGLDRIEFANRGARDVSALTEGGLAFLRMVQQELNVPIRWVGTGFGTSDAIELHPCQLDVPTHA